MVEGVLGWANVSEADVLWNWVNIEDCNQGRSSASIIPTGNLLKFSEFTMGLYELTCFVSFLKHFSGSIQTTTGWRATRNYDGCCGKLVWLTAIWEVLTYIYTRVAAWASSATYLPIWNAESVRIVLKHICNKYGIWSPWQWLPARYWASVETRRGVEWVIWDIEIENIKDVIGSQSAVKCTAAWDEK
jgi:hypothetical protein